jgi:hypothetical protein
MAVSMANPTDPVSLRVRLSSEAWRRFNQRAVLRNTPGQYADMIFHYLLHESGAKPPVAVAVPKMDDEEEPVYFELAVARETRRRLEAWSERERVSLAAFGGALIEGFITRFERDPRDLGMMHHLVSRLDESARVSETELREAVSLYERNAAARLPEGYFAKWIFTRIRPLVGGVKSAGAERELTTEMIQTILDDADR